MAKTRVLLPAFVLLLSNVFLTCLAGCDPCMFKTDCGNKPQKLPAYANKSGVDVKIVAIEKYYSYEKFVPKGDTLHSSDEKEEWGIPSWDCGFYSTLNCNDPIRMELYFLDEQQKCLVFDGLIKNDGVDMRSWKSYEKGATIDNWADFWEGIEYVYTITEELRAMAKEEFCP